MKNYLPLFFLFFFLSSSFAQTDIPQSEDHPLLSRYPEAYISSYEKIKYRDYSLAHGPITKYRFIEEKKSIAGQLCRITYTIDRNTEQLSLDEVYQDYLQALQKADVSIMAEGLFPNRNVDKKVGGGSWIGVALQENKFPQKSTANLLFKGTSSSGGTFAIVGNLVRPDGKTYLAIYGERHSNTKIIYHIDILEEKNAETGKVSVDADYLKKELEAKGKVAIYGITFDFDSATITPTSESTLEVIAQFLKDSPQLSIYVVGHTDMKGDLEYNRQLSLRRAEAVVEALSQNYQIDAKRLRAHGVGPLVPKSSNAEEAGRALNRRVELVQIIH